MASNVNVFKAAPPQITPLVAGDKLLPCGLWEGPGLRARAGFHPQGQSFPQL